ncbi:hypothetical protein CANCADRAFT_112006 [Tortispora caseinolytica NRRL Y-17796]|uniref:Pyruvate decarboxylase n=1 Tax=Tortispora caseinolytica NRRL Y-17796 TaxID=767744 RepID=A0A1E4TGK8_9ASCO|nr:hypothetical protein CANCADRAFT_112006 [Tortispora caseinolytica NRRL Y-17796]
MTHDSQVTVGQYLFSRLKDIGVRHVFGVPGDFQLQLLDFIYTVPEMVWVGCCNELNAAYAADGYARVRRIPGAVVTTYGVGESSALNGVSGAYAENVPLIHIVGMPIRPVQEKRLMVHHALPSPGRNAPDYKSYVPLSQNVSCCQEVLWEESEAAQQIDNAILQAYKQNLPTYIYVPLDLAMQPISSAPLSSPLDFEFRNDTAQEDAALKEILDLIYKAKTPAILADIITDRAHSRVLANELVDITQFPAYNSALGHGILDESGPNFVGVYQGYNASIDGVHQSLESSDLVLELGPLRSDTNLGGFSRGLDDSKVISFRPEFIDVCGKKFDGLHMLPLLKKLVKSLDKTKLSATRKASDIKVGTFLPSTKADSSKLNHQTLVQSFIDAKFFQPNDIVVAEVGTIQFSILDAPFAKDTSFISQIFYSSIGMALPAALGALIAAREVSELGLPMAEGAVTPGRVVLLEGDGSAQMTIQEFGTMARFGLKPVVMLLNNDGYSIERAIHGPEQGYNDICPSWKWRNLFSVFGCKDSDIETILVDDPTDLQKYLSRDSLKVPQKVEFSEVILPMLDYPWRLNKIVTRMRGYNMNLIKEYLASRQAKA